MFTCARQVMDESTRRKITVRFLLVVLPVIVFQGQACSPMHSIDNLDIASSAVDGEMEPGSVYQPGSREDNTDGSVTGEEAFRVVDVSQASNSISSILDIDMVAEKDVHQRNVSLNVFLSDTGEVDTVNAPMVLALSGIAGEGCTLVVAREATVGVTSRRYFRNFDFTKGPASVASTSIGETVRLFARAAWMRDETASELAIINDELKVFNSALPSDTRSMATVLCTAMLSSLSANVR